MDEVVGCFGLTNDNEVVHIAETALSQQVDDLPRHNDWISVDVAAMVPMLLRDVVGDYSFRMFQRTRVCQILTTPRPATEPLESRQMA